MHKKKDKTVSPSGKGFPKKEPLKSKADFNRQLLIACMEGKKDKAKEALDNGADPDTRDRYGRTPLMHAAMENFTEIGEMLLERDADPKAEDNSGNTAIHYAGMFYNKHMLRLLDSSSAA